jgi:hypothetical protein
MQAVHLLIEKLPAGYIQIMLPLLIIFAGVYVLPRVRRDKQGKLYFYSQKYEDGKRNKKQDKILDEVGRLASGMAGMLDAHIKAEAEVLGAVKEDIEESKKDRNELHLDSLKQSVYLNEMDIEERLYAGLRYIRRGGNGAVGRYVRDTLLAGAPISYKAITSLHPELRLEGV